MPTDAGPTRPLALFSLECGSPKRSTSYTLSPELLAANSVAGFERMDERSHPFFGMRSRLLELALGRDQRIFAVTSAEPGNGKTHVAVNLAAALSRITRTVLVEADFRRPSLGGRLGLPGYHPGLDDFLAGEASMAETAIEVRGYDLTVHVVREPRGSPEKLLATRRLTEFFDQIRALEDRPICIVDAPPAMIDDIMLIKRLVDGALVVVEEGRTTKRALLSTIHVLSPTPVVGSVLNKSIFNAGPTVGYGYYAHESQSLPARDGA